VPGEDLEDIEGEHSVKDRAWGWVFGQKRWDLVRLVKQGVLAGKRKARGTLVNVGSFYDWLGEPCPVPPEWGMAHEVYHDEKVEEVCRLRQARQEARCMLELLAFAPTYSVREASEPDVEG
jgi:hypothetical protein